MRLHVGIERPCRLPGVEPALSARRDPAKCAGERGAVEPVSLCALERDARELAARRPERTGVGERVEMPAHLGEREEIEPRDLDPLLRRFDGGCHHLRERQSAEHRMSVAAPGDGPRHRHGEEPPLGTVARGEGMAVTGGCAGAVRLEHRRGRRERCACVRIEAQEAAAIGRPGRDSGIAAEPAHRRLDHEGGERGADQRVERVPAFLHDAHAGIGDRRMSAGAHAALRLDWSACVDGLASAGTLRHGSVSLERTNRGRAVIVAQAPARTPASAAPPGPLHATAPVPGRSTWRSVVRYGASPEARVGRRVDAFG